MLLSSNQKDILGILLDKFEKSKHNADGMESNRAVMIKPSDVYKDYDDDYADTDIERDFERDVYELKKQNLVDIRVKGKKIHRITLIIDSVSRIYTMLDREPQKELIQREIELYNKYIGLYAIIDDYCKHQIELLQAGKKAKYEIRVAAELLRLLKFVCSNKNIILERELSIAVFGDTKVFENEYKSKLIYVLKNYGKYGEIIADAEDEKELVRAILEEINIYANPKYVYFKGNAEIKFSDGKSYILSNNLPLAIPMDKFMLITSFEIKDASVMTIENLASYNRIAVSDCFCIYLGGYHNSAKQALIKLIYSHNSKKNWIHFGDIDPDGFWIIENLKRRTEIDFNPIYMGIDELKKYEKYTKKLQKNDIIKAKSLIEKGLYVEVMQYMLNNNVKLEQEIVSWMGINE